MGGIPEEKTIQRIEIPSQELHVYLAGIFFETSLNSVGFIKNSRNIHNQQNDFLYWIVYLPDKNKFAPYFDDINFVINKFWKDYKLNEIPNFFKSRRWNLFITNTFQI